MKKKLTVEELLSDKNKEYYLPIFKEFEEGKTKKSFNKAALLAAPYWCIYRKMIFKGISIIGLQIILCMLAYIFKTPLMIGIYLLSFLIYVKMGFFGNYTYYKRLKKAVEEYKGVDDKYYDKFVADKKGTDLYLAICWVVGTIILGGIALFL